MVVRTATFFAAGLARFGGRLRGESAAVASRGCKPTGNPIAAEARKARRVTAMGAPAYEMQPTIKGKPTRCNGWALWTNTRRESLLAGDGLDRFLGVLGQFTL